MAVPATPNVRVGAALRCSIKPFREWGGGGYARATKDVQKNVVGEIMQFWGGGLHKMQMGPWKDRALIFRALICPVTYISKDKDKDMPTFRLPEKMKKKKVRWRLGGTRANRDPEILKKGRGGYTTNLHTCFFAWKISSTNPLPPPPDRHEDTGHHVQGWPVTAQAPVPTQPVPCLCPPSTVIPHHLDIA